MDTLAFGYILPTTGRIRDFNPLETCAARRTIRTTGLAGGLFWPYKGLLPALSLKTRRMVRQPQHHFSTEPPGLILFVLLYRLTRERVDILF